MAGFPARNKKAARCLDKKQTADGEGRVIFLLCFCGNGENRGSLPMGTSIL